MNLSRRRSTQRTKLLHHPPTRLKQKQLPQVELACRRRASERFLRRLQNHCAQRPSCQRMLFAYAHSLRLQLRRARCQKMLLRQDVFRLFVASAKLAQSSCLRVLVSTNKCMVSYTQKRASATQSLLRSYITTRLNSPSRPRGRLQLIQIKDRPRMATGLGQMMQEVQMEVKQNTMTNSQKLLRRYLHSKMLCVSSARLSLCRNALLVSITQKP